MRGLAELLCAVAMVAYIAAFGYVLLLIGTKP